jgi:hypothetical protein
MPSSHATEQEYLEDNISTVAWHLGRPGAHVTISYDGGAKLVVSLGNVLAEIARRLESYPAQQPDVRSRLARECIENLNATDDGDPAGNLINVLKRGFVSLGWAQPSLAAEQLIDAIGAAQEQRHPEDRSIFVLQEIARGRCDNGRPLSGETARNMARSALDFWPGRNAPVTHTDSPSDGAIYAAVSQRGMTDEERKSLDAAIDNAVARPDRTQK